MLSLSLFRSAGEILMPDINNLMIFLSACLVLWLTPGPDTLYILGRTLAEGRLSGVLSVLGIGAGILIHTVLAATGLSAILAASAEAFTLIKWAGALYLVYLGIATLRHRPQQADHNLPPPMSRSRVFTQGMLTNLLNPKIALFFLAFLPQFVGTDSQGSALPFLLLGGIFVTGGTLWCLLLVLFSDTFARWLLPSARPDQSGRSVSRVQKLVGTVYIGLGLHLLTTRLSQ